MGDIEILEKILSLTDSSLKQSDLYEVSSRIMAHLEALSFTDGDWFDKITQHVVTLDSAASFEGGSVDEMKSVKRAVSTALEQIKSLVENQLENRSIR